MPLLQIFPDPECCPNGQPKVDIFAIHGLNPRGEKDADHVWNTWRTPPEPNGRLWLRDDLPKALPESRIFLYQYDAAGWRGDPKAFISEANELLEWIRINRDDELRPILFFGHSIGGLLIKQALINAHNNPKYTPIKSATKGLAFFATPHNSGDQRPPSAIERISIILGIQERNVVLETLKDSIPPGIEEYWGYQQSGYDIISFRGSRDSVVPMGSARLGLPGYRGSIVELDANHEEVCRFGDSQTDQDNLELVQQNIRDIYERALSP